MGQEYHDAAGDSHRKIRLLLFIPLFIPLFISLFIQILFVQTLFIQTPFVADF